MAKRLREHGIKLVSIAQWSPRWLKCDANEIELAPNRDILRDAKDGTIDWKEYSKRYKDQLSKSKERVKDIIAHYEADGEDYAFLCYETLRDESKCHRVLLSQYVKRHLGIEIKEWVAPG